MAKGKGGNGVAAVRELAEPIAEKLSGAKDRLAAIAKELLREQ